MAIYGLGNIRDERLHRAFQVPTKSAALLCFCGRCFNCIQGEKGPLRGGHRKNGAVCCHAYSMKDSCGHREVVPRDDPAPEQVKACGRFCSLTPRMRLEAQGKQRCSSQQGVGASKLLPALGPLKALGTEVSGASTRRCSLPSWIWQGVLAVSGSLNS